MSVRLDDVMHQSNRHERILLPIGTVHDLALFYGILCFRALADVGIPFPAAYNPNAVETDQHAGCSEAYPFALTTASLRLKPMLQAQCRIFGYLWNVWETGTRRRPPSVACILSGHA
ncbi:unnamed protein product [Mycena citricolor]|uniref:Uncharacterized protein n=1 Tax=Mycena citricolor TaxID=2018698 RepID=A0AAD2GWI2_9AGAR|nr:unnamed protein product [Mycena citricolor]